MNVNFDALFAKADGFRHDAKITEALQAYNEIIELATENHEAGHRARATHLAGVTLMATIRHGTQSSYRDTLKLLTEALGLFQSLGDVGGMGAVLRDQAIAADRVGDFATAVLAFQKSLETLQDANNPAELAITYDKLGLHFGRIGQPQAALDHINKALEIFRQAPTAGFYRATTLLDQARTLFQLKNYPESLAVGEEALSWFEAEHPGQNYDLRRAQLYGLIALIQNELGQARLAAEASKKLSPLLKKFPVEAAQAVQEELDTLVG